MGTPHLVIPRPRGTMQPLTGCRTSQFDHGTETGEAILTTLHAIKASSVTGGDILRAAFLDHTPVDGGKTSHQIPRISTTVDRLRHAKPKIRG